MRYLLGWLLLLAAPLGAQRVRIPVRKDVAPRAAMMAAASVPAPCKPVIQPFLDTLAAEAQRPQGIRKSVGVRMTAAIDSAVSVCVLPSAPVPPDTVFRVDTLIRHDTVTRVDTVFAPPPNRAPVASFAWRCTVGSCTMTSTSTDPDGDPLSCAWHSDATYHADLAGCAITRQAFGLAWAERLTVTDPSGLRSVSNQAITPPPTPVDTTPAPTCTTCKTTLVTSGGNLQGALNSALPGDSVALDSGAVFTGNYVLPKHAAGLPIVLVARGTLPPPGTRRTAAFLTARIQTPNNQPALSTALGACGWRVVGVELGMDPMIPATQINGAIVALGDGAQTTAADVACDLELDRVLVRAGPTQMTRRCVALNSASTTIRESSLLECHAQGFDAQAIGGWNGPGPYLIENNQLEGSGENIMFGGAVPSLPGNVPSDITIRGNYLYKPAAWRTTWTASVKNLFELKAARRVLLEGNVMRGSWVDAQNGFAITLNASSTSQTGTGGCTWCIVDSVVIRGNWIDSVESGINFAPQPQASAKALGTHRITVVGNLITTVASRAFQFLPGVDSIIVDRNTAVVSNATTGIGFNFSENPPVPRVGFVFTNNLAGGGRYPIQSPLTSPATAWTAFGLYAPSGTVTGNAVVCGTLNLGTPVPGNRCVTSATDPLALGAGVDVAALKRALATVVVP